MGIFGLYYSLQFLSLSDATVLQFLSPIFTAIGGSIFLKEAFSIREAFAGCKQATVVVLLHGSSFSQVASLVGVMLIARPTFLFGDRAAERYLTCTVFGHWLDDELIAGLQNACDV